MLNTTYYNQRLIDLRLQSEFSGTIASLIESINTFDSVVVGLLAQEAARTGSPIAAQEALGEYFQRGKGSLAKGAATAMGALALMGKWAVQMIQKMTVFAVKGFRGTVEAAVRVATEIGSKIEDMQDVVLQKVLSANAFKAIGGIMDEHSADVGITVPSGKITDAKIAFINQFNTKMSGAAKVGKNFALVKAPQPAKKASLRDSGFHNVDAFKESGDFLGKAEVALKERLDKIKEVGGKINSIIRQLNNKGKSNMQQADSVQVVSGACHAAVLANDLKYLRAAEVIFMDMVNQLEKRSKEYARDDSGTVTTP